MSRSTATIYFSGGTTFYGESSNCDFVMATGIFPTSELRDEIFGTFPQAECVCGEPKECVIHSDYGGGFYWRGLACPECRAIIAGESTSPFDWDTEMTDGAVTKIDI